MRLYRPLLAVLLVLALVLSSPLLLDLVWCLTALLVIAWLWTWHAANALDLRRRVATRAFTGDEVRVDFRVTNRSILPLPPLELDEPTPHDLREGPAVPHALALRSRESRDLSYTLTCRRRGYYDLGPAALRIGDLLGLSERRVIHPESNHLIVYPRVLPLERLGLPTRSALVALPTRTPLFEDPSRVTGVREYQPTDSLRHMHWTASAQLGTLVVKRFQPATARSTMILLDLDLRDYEPRERPYAIEQAIVVAASFANHVIVNERQAAGLATAGYDPLDDAVRRMTLPAGTRPENLMGILEVLARAEAVRGEHFTALLQETAIGLPWGSTVLAITGSLSHDLESALLTLQQRGAAVGLVLVRPEMPGPPGRIPTYRVWDDAEIRAAGAIA